MQIVEYMTDRVADLGRVFDLLDLASALRFTLSVLLDLINVIGVC